MVAAGSPGARRWVVLTLGIAAQTAASAFIYGIPMLVPALRRSEHLSLAAAGELVAAPTVGVLLTLIAWGALADRRGERLVMVAGLAGAAGCLAASATVAGIVPRAVLLGAAGAFGASVNAASGRLVLGWFPPERRGAAMGARQTAQPLGVAVAALVLPPVAASAGVGTALVVLAALCAVVAVAVAAGAADPPRTLQRDAGVEPSPYRGPALWRLHAASALLVVPQFAVSAFSLEYLVGARHWSATAAGRLLFAFQLAGAAGRLATGWWSDRVGSRLAPMRRVAVAAAVVMGLAALGAATGSALAVVALGAAAVITVADNGLAFTSVAELAGPAWAGRALGAQNTGQNIVASLTPPALGALVAAAGYGAGFAACAVPPLVAVAVTPVAAEIARRALPVR
ncbi:MAG TPA: MFS transporter [Acidimicrobiales bacterium]|nr:MFS transporter [Acidimicrobiales bacterium]